MDRRLGEPLPHQLSNPTRAHPCAINLWHRKHAISVRYAVLSSVSRCYPPHKGRLLTRYSPVRHWSPRRVHRSTWMCYARRQRSSWARIKLSNKLYQFTLPSVLIIRAIYSSFLLLFRVVFSLVFLTDSFSHLLFLLCTFFFCCSIVKFQFCCPFLRQLYYSTTFPFICQAFF